MAQTTLPFVLLAAFGLQSYAASPQDYFRAIRANETAKLRGLIGSGGINAPDGRGTTPLHYAAAFGSVDSVKALLAGGADVKAKNTMEATPLILAASSPEKLRLLLAAGSDANAKTKAGRTALIIAAGRTGAAAAVKQLLDAGADVKAEDQMGMTALDTAAAYGDTESVRLLLDRGAEPDHADKGGFTPLMGAVMKNDIELVRLFLSKGANVNAANTFAGTVRHGQIALTKMTPLTIATAHGPVDMVRTLIAAGAKVNVQDNRGMTPLMVTVSSENQDPNVIKLLLEAGADANAKDGYGDSVLDWARKFGHPTTLNILQAAGAKGRTIPAAPVRASAPAEVRESVQLAMGLLQRSSTEFFNQSGCVGCHHQPMTARAEVVVSAAGVMNSTAARDEQRRSAMSVRPLEPMLLQFMDPGGEVDSVGNAMLGFAAAAIPADSLTDASVNYIAGKQNANGSWTMFGVSRVPFEDSTITRTAIAVKALKVYGWPARQAEFDERIARAKAWLSKAEPRNSYERADLLRGLYWAGASEPDLKRVAARLVAEQRQDGGWAQNRYLASDAFATGSALDALHESGRLKITDPAYQRGVEYLRRTQLDDGSWYVRSRAPKFQPYFQSGFPHDHDQWISAVATAYSVMALAPAAEKPVATAHR